jgi:hypothetical protein
MRMATDLKYLVQHTPEHRKLSKHFEDIFNVPGIVMDMDFFEKKAKDRILHFIVTSAHVDDDGEIDNIDSVAKLIPDMLSSERGVSLTLLHTDTINGKVYHLEKTTIGEVAERFPKMKERLNSDVNQDVACIYGESKMYTDTPALDDVVWKLCQNGTLNVVSLRGVGKTKKHSNVCDVEGNCGKEVMGTKFWSVTLAEDGQQSKPYSVVLTKMKKDVKKMPDCGGTVSEVKTKDTKITELEKENLELKTKMKEDENPPIEDEKTKMEDNDEKDEKDSKKKEKMTCPKCGESYGSDMKKMSKEGYTLVQDEQLIQLMDDSDQFRKMAKEEEMSEAQKRLQSHFGDGVKIKTKSAIPAALTKKEQVQAYQELIKADPEAFGLQKTNTPESNAGGVKPGEKEKEISIPGLEVINAYSHKIKGRIATNAEVIAIQVNGGKMEKVII